MAWNLTKAARSGWLLAGFAFGLGKIVSALLPRTATPAKHDVLGVRVDALDKAVARLETRTEALCATNESPIDRVQLEAAIEEAIAPLSSALDRRYGQNAESVEALRLMVSKTDELLGRLLEQLESRQHETAA